MKIYAIIAKNSHSCYVRTSRRNCNAAIYIKRAVIASLVNRRNAIAKLKATRITSTMATLAFLIQSGRPSYFCRADRSGEKQLSFCMLLFYMTLATDLQLLLKIIFRVSNFTSLPIIFL